VETPVGYVDLEVARQNARRVARYAREHGLSWRPHVKTHKSRAVARIQLDAGASGLTVATLREAEVMADLTHDLLLAYPPVGSAKLERLIRLASGGTRAPAGNGDGPARLTVALDHPGVLEGLGAACAESGVEVGVLVEMDVGLGRTGVAGPEEVVVLARAADASPGVYFRGLLFYPGHIRSREEEQAGPVAAVGERLAATLRALEAAGHPPQVVSGGSTPTLWRSHLLPGLTEIRSGSCIYFDREAVEVGVAALDKVAYTVLATVVSTAVPGRAVVDAGSKALAKEARAGQGYGFVRDHPEVLVAGLSEEHGILDLSATDWRPRVGERVRLVPNHVCVSVNLHDALLARDGEEHHWLELEGRGRRPWTG
jgi:D-serine deaminase-like pyridoxal phosphate-dependent protein